MEDGSRRAIREDDRGIWWLSSLNSVKPLASVAIWTRLNERTRRRRWTRDRAEGILKRTPGLNYIRKRGGHTFPGDIVVDSQIKIFPVPHLVREDDLPFEVEHRYVRAIEGHSRLVAPRTPSVEDRRHGEGWTAGLYPRMSAALLGRREEVEVRTSSIAVVITERVPVRSRVGEGEIVD